MDYYKIYFFIYYFQYMIIAIITYVFISELWGWFNFFIIIIVYPVFNMSIAPNFLFFNLSLLKYWKAIYLKLVSFFKSKKYLFSSIFLSLLFGRYLYNLSSKSQSKSSKILFIFNVVNLILFYIFSIISTSYNFLYSHHLLIFINVFLKIKGIEI